MCFQRQTFTVFASLHGECRKSVGGTGKERNKGVGREKKGTLNKAANTTTTISTNLRPFLTHFRITFNNLNNS